MLWVKRIKIYLIQGGGGVNPTTIKNPFALPPGYRTHTKIVFEPFLYVYTVKYVQTKYWLYNIVMSDVCKTVYIIHARIGGGGSGRSGTPWKIQISYLNLHSKITHNMLRIPPPFPGKFKYPSEHTGKIFWIRTWHVEAKSYTKYSLSGFNKVKFSRACIIYSRIDYIVCIHY